MSTRLRIACAARDHARPTMAAYLALCIAWIAGALYASLSDASGWLVATVCVAGLGAQTYVGSILRRAWNDGT